MSDKFQTYLKIPNRDCVGNIDGPLAYTDYCFDRADAWLCSGREEAMRLSIAWLLVACRVLKDVIPHD